MSSAIDKKNEMGFFTCCCNNNLFKIYYFKWHHKNNTITQEFYIDFITSRIHSLRNRFKMALDVLFGRPVYYLTLNKQDAINLGIFLCEKVNGR